MPTADIYLRKSKTKAISKLEVATGKGADADVTVDPSDASLTMGGGTGSNSSGDIALQDSGGSARIELLATGGKKKNPQKNRVFVDGTDGTVELGELRTNAGNADIELTPRDARAKLGGGAGGNSDGELVLAEEAGNQKVHLDTKAGGPGGSDTNVYVSGPRMSNSVRQQATLDSNVTVDGGAGLLNLGGRGQNGRLTMYRSQDVPGTFETVLLDGGPGLLRVGGTTGEGRPGGVDGRIRARNGQGVDVFDVNAADGTAQVGGKGGSNTGPGAQSGAVQVVHESGDTTAELRGHEGSVVAGGQNTSGAVLLKHEDPNGSTVQYLLEATQQGLVVSTDKRSSGSSTVNRNEALRIEPDGTVRVKGGSVKPL